MNPSDIGTTTEQDLAKEMHFSNARKTLVILVMGLFLISLGIWTVNQFVDRHDPTPLLLHFQGVKEMGEMEFVQLHYNEIVPVTTKEGHLELLLNVPAKVTGKMDMTQLSYELLKDSILQVTLPPVSISEVEVNLTHVTDEFSKNSKLHVFLSGGGRSYSHVYDAIMLAIGTTKKGVLSHSIQDDILEQTDKEARAYLIKISASLGYHIQFVRDHYTNDLEKLLEKRVGGKLWKDVKHKVKSAQNAIPKKGIKLFQDLKKITKTEEK
jgi:hypothetical protein